MTDKTTQVYTAIAAAYTAAANCDESGNTVWGPKWRAQLSYIEKTILPNGSGFDTRPEIISATDEKIIIHGAYHCMNENGYYDGWIDFTVTVKPSLLFGFSLDVKASGMTWPRRYVDTRDYIAECYHDALSAVMGINDGQE